MYNGRNLYAIQDKVFCVNGFRESFDLDEAHRHNISQAQEEEAEEVPPAEEHDPDGGESPSEATTEGVGEPAGDLGC